MTPKCSVWGCDRDATILYRPYYCDGNKGKPFHLCYECDIQMHNDLQVVDK